MKPMVRGGGLRAMLADLMAPVAPEAVDGILSKVDAGSCSRSARKA